MSERVPWAITEAMEQISDYNERPDCHVAAVFAVPYIRPKNNVPIAEARIAARNDEVALGHRRGLRVDYYPVVDDEEDPEADEWRFPGVSLFLAFRKK